MGRKCSVDGCLSDSTRPEDVGVTFHKAPSQPDTRSKWITSCKISEDKLSKVIYVCSRHFLRADFCNFKGKKYVLRQGVIPSVFPWDKSKLGEIKTNNEMDASPSSPPTNRTMDLEDFKLTENLSSEMLSGAGAGTGAGNQCCGDQVKTEGAYSSDSQKGGVIDFIIDSQIEALDFNNVWCPARIVEVDYEDNEVLINSPNIKSEWISMDSPRLRPLQEKLSGSGTPSVPISTDHVDKKLNIEQYVVGERCLASWSDARKFPATVTKVNDDDFYEVLFDDGFVKNLRAHRMVKAEGRILQSSPLFDPIQSSKQERRDKKRKHNVAQLFGKVVKRSRSDVSEVHNDTPAPAVPQVVAKTPQKVQPVKKKAPRRSAPKPLGRSTPKPIVSKAATSSTNVAPTPSPAPTSVPGVHPVGVLPDRPVEQPVDWLPKWINGSPVGVDSTIETCDGTRKSVIIADPRLPKGWVKHLTRRVSGMLVGKWDTVIVGPDNRRFRSKAEIKVYMELHPEMNLSESMFDFSLHKQKPRKSTSSQKFTEAPSPVSEPAVTPAGVAQEEITSEPAESEREKEAENQLKIAFVDEAYKCPIEGCGKSFRKENLAQMHVKHYHPEYTKFLDSTPNVADLAYARTVGDSLDRSPGSGRSVSLKTNQKPGTPKHGTLKSLLDSDVKPLSPVPSATSASSSKVKDAEIIKLLNSKPYEPADEKEHVPERETVKTSTSPSHPNYKLKELLNKSETIPKIDEKLLRNLGSSRPTGIKTLLPVRSSIEAEVPPKELDTSGPPPLIPLPSKKTHREKSHHRHSAKRRKTAPAATSVEPIVDKQPPPVEIPAAEPPPEQPPVAQPPEQPTHIIEGGKVIKIVRMKQEEIINCTCGYAEEDGLMIQCELCYCWQHAYCNNITCESQVPDNYTCYICQNPLKQRASRKYYHDQEWLKQGVLPSASYHSRDPEVLSRRFEKLKKSHDISGALVELKDYVHSLRVKLKVADAKDHPKLYLWSKPWEKLPLPEKTEVKSEQTIKQEEEVVPEEIVPEEIVPEEMVPEEIVPEDVKPDACDKNSMFLLDNGQTSTPLIPEPQAAIDSSVCRLNLLEHISHSMGLVEERLDDFEQKIAALEEDMPSSVQEDPDTMPRTRQTMQMLLKDLGTLQDLSKLNSI